METERKKIFREGWKFIESTYLHMWNHFDDISIEKEKIESSNYRQ